MASAELNKVLELLKSQPRNPDATVEKMRAGMEKVSERVARDVTCDALRIGDIVAEWIVPPEAASDRVILYLHGGISFPLRWMTPSLHTSGFSGKVTSPARLRSRETQQAVV
jgi:hypothetical protein